MADRYRPGTRTLCPLSNLGPHTYASMTIAGFANSLVFRCISLFSFCTHYKRQMHADGVGGDVSMPQHRKLVLFLYSLQPENLSLFDYQQAFQTLKGAGQG